MYDQASLHQNQIGDFLKRVDYEQETRQQQIELQVDTENMQKSLNEIFARIGFNPSADFNLSNDNDYKLAHDTLMRYRNKLLSEVISEVSSLQNNDNDVIAERMIKVNNLIQALQKDDDAYTVLSDTSKADADLDEKIKSEKANRQVASKYKEKADQDFERQLNQVGNIYCSELSGNF